MFGLVETCSNWSKLFQIGRNVFKLVENKAVFYNNNGEELETIDVTKMTRDELNALITANDIPVKNNKHDKVTIVTIMVSSK